VANSAFQKYDNSPKDKYVFNKLSHDSKVLYAYIGLSYWFIQDVCVCAKTLIAQ
jgi:hypothetical protein